MDKSIKEQLREPGTLSPAGPGSSVTGELILHEFPSRRFRNRRMLRVWLPPGYHDPENSGRRYPVFYLNDGQNLFDRATAFGGVEWRVDETADFLIRQGEVPPLIIVGIDNAQNDRMKEYLPYRSFNPTILRPQGKDYPDFLMQEIMPFVGERYRVAPGPENTGLGGSSMGALIALYTAVDRPAVFGRLLLESPSLFIAHRRMLKYSRYFREWPERIFLAIGTGESDREDKNRQFVDDVRDLVGVLARAGLDERRLRVRIEAGAPHSEAAWAARFPEALRFLFGAAQMEADPARAG